MSKRPTTIAVDAVEAELQRLAATCPPFYRPWSPREIHLLTKYYRTVKGRDLATALNRSLQSIYQKAQNLGLARP
jgi:hypothetical protein